ncbi:MAG: hypothetical protein JWM19_4606 [Actinomycetia bacterium]|nr:hypothetical protein [Actinomycetes bacterium]
MSDVGLIAIIVAAFGLAIWLVRVLGGLINSDDGDGDGRADEPPDTGPVDAAGLGGTANRASAANGASASPTVIQPKRSRWPLP